jgi:cathepsin C
MPLLSPQYLMTCNYMNEGCDGGWPLFHGFMAENGYLVTEECAPYKMKTKGQSCSIYQQCEPHSKVRKTYFVGKGYGDTSEKKMMKEIMRSGPVNGELQAPRVFSMYTDGILSQDGLRKLHKKVSCLSQQSSENEVSDRTLSDYGISWQNLNHSVVIIGWGTDPKTK